MFYQKFSMCSFSDLLIPHLSLCQLLFQRFADAAMLSWTLSYTFCMLFQRSHFIITTKSITIYRTEFSCHYHNLSSEACHSFEPILTPSIPRKVLKTCRNLQFRSKKRESITHGISLLIIYSLKDFT